VVVRPDGSLTAGNKTDFSLPRMRERVLSTSPRLAGIPLSCIAHTLALYRRLPVGWETTPPGTATDIHMCRKLVGDPDCRAVSGTRPTVLRFPSPKRTRWSPDERAAELARWSARLSDGEWLASLPLEVLDALVREDARKFVETRVVKFEVRQKEGRRRVRARAVRRRRAAERERWAVERAHRRDQVIALRRRLGELRARLEKAASERASLRAALAEARDAQRRKEEECRALRDARPARVSRRLASLPVLGPLLRALARLAAPRAAR
jgi:hypothetical protein